MKTQIEIEEKLIINEGKTGHGEIKTFNYEVLKNLNKNAICELELGNIKGTGFFCKIPSPQNKNENIIVLLTCYHVLPLNKYEISQIFYHIENEDKKVLNLKNRKKWRDEELDYTCIEILEEDNITNYLNIDENIIQDNYPIKELQKKAIYIFNSKLEFSVGNIIKIWNNLLHYDSDTTYGWSGSPIFNKNNNNVIAIHKGFDEQLNIGVFIRTILKHMKNEKDNIPDIIVNEG